MRKLLSVLSLLPMVAFAANGTLKGAGTESNPWQIEDYDDLKAIGSGSYLYSNHYVLVADIDASASLFTPIGTLEDAAEKTDFSGSFDGRNHTIKNLKIQTQGQNGVGFIKSLDYAKLVNVNFDKLTVLAGDQDDSGKSVGGVVGYAGNSFMEHVNVTNGFVQGTGFVGGVVGIIGEATDPSVTRNCTFQGRVVGDSIVGGFVGRLYQYFGREKTFWNISADVDLYAYGNKIGGLIGEIDYPSMGANLVSNSHATGTITLAEAGHDYGIGYIRQAANRSRSYVGGFVGYNDGEVLQCYSAVDILGRGDSFSSFYVAGFVGHNGGLITKSYATGNVSGNEYVAGFVGEHYGDKGWLNTAIRYAYATGTVTGDSLVAGFAGDARFNFDDAYSACTLVSDGSKYGLAAKTESRGWYKNSYWNTETASTTYEDGGVGLTTSEMTHMASFGNWSESLGYDGNPVWTIVEGKTFPLLASIPQGYENLMLTAVPTSAEKYTETPVFHSPEATGIDYFARWTGAVDYNSDKDSVYYEYQVGYETAPGDTLWGGFSHMAASNIFEVSSVEELQKIGQDMYHPNGGLYFLTADLDFEGVDFKPIERSDGAFFAGELDGQGHTIKNLTINQPEANGVGLFAGLGVCSVKNLVFENATVKGGNDVGVLAGRASWANVEDVISYNGTVVGEDRVGGLIGRVQGATGESLYNKLASTGNVSGDDYVGGVVGLLETSLTNAYSVGKVEGDSYVSGIAGGIDGGTIKRSYSANELKGVKNVGGIAYGSGTRQNNYYDVEKSGEVTGDSARTTVQMVTKANYVGWDFENVWTIDEGMSYPYFKKAKPMNTEYEIPSEGPLFVASTAVSGKSGLNVTVASGVANVQFRMAQEGEVVIRLMDVRGRSVYSLNLGELAAGVYNKTLDFASLAKGRYVVTLQVNGRLTENAFVNVKSF